MSGDRRRAFPHGPGPRVQLAMRTMPKPRRLARDLRSPNTTAWYGDLDPRSVAVLLAVLRRQRPSREAWRTAAHALAVVRRSGRLICSLPRSGMHWTHVMVMSALDLSDGGDGEYDFRPEGSLPRVTADGRPRAQEQWVPRGRPYLWPSAIDALLRRSAERTRADVPPTAFMVSHVPLQHRPFDITRMRPVLVVRHPAASLPSLMHYEGVDRVTADPALRAALLRRTEQYLTFWAEQRRARPAGHPHHPLVVRYEDLQVDAGAELRRIARHWDLDLSDEHVARAVELSSRDRMVAKTGAVPNVRVTVAKQELPEIVAASVAETVARPAVRRALADLGYPDGEPVRADGAAPSGR